MCLLKMEEVSSLASRESMRTSSMLLHQAEARIKAELKAGKGLALKTCSTQD
jgi:hypothetical protein